MENKKEKTIATEIQYVQGDATKPIGDGMKIIVHVCNNIGAWGAGFVLALSKRWDRPEKFYRSKDNYKLGHYDLVQVEKDITVCNLIGQEGIRYTNDLPPVRYIAIEKGLTILSNILTISNEPITIHMPMIGSGLAGGNWKIIERIIEVTLCEKGIPVTVYKFD